LKGKEMFDSIQDLLEFFAKEKFKALNLGTSDLVHYLDKEEIGEILDDYKKEMIELVDRVFHERVFEDVKSVDKEVLETKLNDYLEMLQNKSPETYDMFDQVDDIILVNLIYELLLFVDRETAFDMMDGKTTLSDYLKHETEDTEDDENA
jgi:hypothetical protein